jgi:hypothetical protein
MQAAQLQDGFMDLRYAGGANRMPLCKQPA